MMDARRLIRAVWRFSWVVTLPTALMTLALVLPVARDTVQFTLYHPASLHRSSDIDLHLRQIMLSRLNAIRADLISSWRGRWSDLPSDIPVLDLRVSNADLARLNANLPRSGKDQWVRADFHAGNVRYDNARVRYRGDSLHHWGLEAKSWTIRTPRRRPWQGYRRWLAILPRWRAASSYYVNLKLAQRMGVLAPDPQVVALRINGREHGGVHLLMPDQDETFLRRNGRLPGDLYVGDLTPFDHGYINEETEGHGLWELPWLWQKASANNQFQRDSHLPLEILFHRLYAGSTDDLLQLLDVPAWARFAAYMQLFAANHMDMGHNWKLFYDHGKLRFEPVLGDGNGLPDDVLAQVAGLPGLDSSVTTPLLARLHEDHTFVRLKNEALASFFRSGLDRAYFDELDRFVDTVSPILDVYPQLDWMGTTEGAPVHYFDGRQLRARAGRVKPSLRQWFKAQRAQLEFSDPSQVRVALTAADTVRLELNGYGSLRVRVRGVSRPDAPVSLGIQFEDGTRRSFDVTSYVISTPEGLLLDLPLLAQRLITRPSLGRPQGRHEVAATTYDLRFPGATLALDRIECLGLFDEIVKPQMVASIETARFARANTGLVPAPAPAVRWEGLVELESETHIDGRLTIAPGTRIRLGPDASVVVRGSIDARGTRTAPIVIERRDPSKAWGAFIVIGTGREHSYFSYCDVSGGSGLVSPYVLFSGMISIHYQAIADVDHCRFSDNTVFDDQFHAVYSTVRVNDSTFESAASDAIDLDISRAEFERIHVIKPGNDCLDLMTSHVVMRGSLLERAGDKGVSVGEGSEVAVIDTRLAGNAIGLQSKDGSVAVVYNSELLGNHQQLSAYHKNLSYPGNARIDVAKSVIDGHDAPFALKDGSTARVFDTRLPDRRPLAGVELDAWSDTGDRARRSGHAPVYAEVLPGPAWQFVNDDLRGVVSTSGDEDGR